MALVSVRVIHGGFTVALAALHCRRQGSTAVGAGTAFQRTNQQIGGTGKKGSSPRVVGRGARRLRRPPKARLMAAAIWREREGTGEVESEQTVTKPRYGGTYERGGIRRRSSTRRRWGSRRWSTYYRGDGDWSSDERRKGQRGGLGSVFIGGRALRRRRKGSGAEWALSM